MMGMHDGKVQSIACYAQVIRCNIKINLKKVVFLFIIGADR